MIITTSRELPHDIKEWRILELKKETLKLCANYPHSAAEEVRFAAVMNEVIRRKS